jgi:hypothetical protein
MDSAAPARLPLLLLAIKLVNQAPKHWGLFPPLILVNFPSSASIPFGMRPPAPHGNKHGRRFFSPSLPYKNLAQALHAFLFPHPSKLSITPHMHVPLLSFPVRTMCGSRTGGWSLPCVMSD